MAAKSKATATEIKSPPEEKLTTYKHEAGMKSPSEEESETSSKGDEITTTDSDSDSDSDSDNLRPEGEHESSSTTGSGSGSGSDSKKVFESGPVSRRSIGRMTPAQWVMYNRQVLESDGFDVGPFGRVCELGIIAPTSVKRNYTEFKKFTDFAIEKQLKEKPKKHLELVEILKGSRQAACPLKYYITFTTKDMDDGGVIKTYQTMVVRRIPLDKTYVGIFREKPLPTPPTTPQCSADDDPGSD